MKKSFKNYIFSRQIILVSLIFLICFIFSTYLHTTLTKQEALNQSKAISNQVFSSMYQVMRKGWSKDDVKLFTTSLEHNFESSNYEINIYRGDKVRELFGDIEEKAKDSTLVDILNGKVEKLDNFENNVVRNILPLKATNDCKTCHINAQIGDVLGVLEVKQDLNSIFSESKYQYIAFFLIIVPIFYLLAFLSSRYTTKQILDSLNLFNDKVQNINSVQDFKAFDSKNIDLYFKEFNEIVQNVDLMAEKLKIVAVDKELLEFEIKLLDKFIITSDVVKDWREYICDLLIEINKIMETYTLMTIFRVGEDQFEVDIFWLGMPKDHQKEVFDAYINKTIKESEYFKEMTDFTIKQENIDADKFETIYNGVDIEEIKKYLANPPKNNLKQELGFADNDKIVLNIARLVKQKNHKLLIEAFARFSKRHNDYKLVIVGDGDLMLEIKNLAKELGVEANVFFLGATKDLYKYYAISDLFVVSSSQEGFCLVAVMALAFGMPVVTTRVAGLIEYIKDDYNGLFCSYDSSDMADKMSIIASLDYQAREAYSNNCKITAEGFDIKKHTKAFEDLFLASLNKK